MWSLPSNFFCPAMNILSVQEKLHLISALMLLGLGGTLKQLFVTHHKKVHCTSNLKGTMSSIFHATKRISLPIPSWISCSHFSRGFLGGRQSKVAAGTHFCHQNKRQVACSSWLGTQTQGPSPHFPSVQTLLSRSGFVQSILCKHVSSCCQLKMSQEFTCYWLHTERRGLSKTTAMTHKEVPTYRASEIRISAVLLKSMPQSWFAATDIWSSIPRKSVLPVLEKVPFYIHLQ